MLVEDGARRSIDTHEQQRPSVNTTSTIMSETIWRIEESSDSTSGDLSNISLRSRVHNDIVAFACEDQVTHLLRNTKMIESHDEENREYHKNE